MQNYVKNTITFCIALLLVASFSEMRIPFFLTCILSYRIDRSMLTRRDVFKLLLLLKLQFKALHYHIILQITNFAQQ